MPRPLYLASLLLFTACRAEESVPSLDTAGLEEVSDNATPVLTLYEPIPGTEYTWSESISVRARVMDDDAPSKLRARISSNIDGDLGERYLTTDGQLDAYVEGLTPGAHDLTIEVIDDEDATDEVSASISVLENRAPSSPLIEIRPEQPTSQDNLEAVVVSPGLDADNDVVSYDWSWEVDGVPVDLDGHEIPSDMTQGQQQWTVQAIASDGSLSSTAVAASVIIDSDGPDVSVWINPSEAYVDDLLVCNWAAGDPQGHEVTAQAEWRVGADYIGDASIPLSEGFIKGDVITCEVVAETERGVTVASDALQILNSPPSIDSMNIQPAYATRDNDLTCEPSVIDADGDALSIDYVWYVNGAQVVEIQGLSTDYFYRDDQVYCEARVDDDDVVSSWRSSGVLIVQNARPTAPVAALDTDMVLEGDPVNCSASGSTDSDADGLTYGYRWTVDGTLQPQDASSFTATDGLTGSTLACSARAWDGYDWSDWSIEAIAQIID